MAERYAADRLSVEDEQEGLLQLVGFEIGKEQFGVNILTVQEIIRSAPVTVVPNSPVFVEGVINLRGDIIPVIDLRKRLNMYEQSMDSDRNWILILNINNKVIGFIVDAVNEVLKVAEDSIEPAPDVVVAGLENQYISGVCEVQDALMIVLNFERVLFNEEITKLKDQSFDDITLDEQQVIK